MVAEQRRRILAAVAPAVASRGFDHTFVRHLIVLAGVSRLTFYEHFDDRREAFLAAYDDAVEGIGGRLEAAWEGQSEWPQQVAASLSAALAYAVAEPQTARLVAVVAPASGATMATRHNRSLDSLIPSLLVGRDLRPNQLLPPSPLLEQALLGAICAVVAKRLHAGEQGLLPALAPQLTEIILTPYLGSAEAKRSAAVRG